MNPATITEDPFLIPGMCFRCRSGKESRKWFIDTGKDTDLEGRLYFCDACMKEFVELMAFDVISVQRHAEQIEQVYEYFKTFADKQDEVARKLDLIDTFIKELSELRGDGGRVISEYGENAAADVRSDSGEPTEESRVDSEIIVPDPTAIKFA